MENILLIALFLPLLGFLTLMVTSSIFSVSRSFVYILGCFTVFISFICFATLFTLSLDSQTFTLFQWIPIKGINAGFTLHLDQLSLLMGLIITGVGFLIHVYSVGYMEHDDSFARFFACLNFFIFAMLLLVLAEHLLLLFVGWEGVGLASYLLIGFWYEKPVAAAAATKAFVVNRIGDLGLLLGLLLTFHLFGTGNITEISQRAPVEFAVGAPIITLLTLLYFFGATGKSAQLPLHTWLPDAMAGPTPVSALIHAATMVTAGVYLVVRLHDLFILAPLTMQVISVIGAATALYAALCALAQTDLKKVLAYSTVSQLGFMFLACGSADFYGAMFHLTMHAFVKALLFLSAGNVLHMVHEITEMDQLGGLAKKLPKTNWLFLIGALALSGIPPLAAFFSKDLILEQEFYVGFLNLFHVGLVASVLTGAYLTRAYCLTFLGKTHLKESVYNAIRDIPAVMFTPLIILATLSIIGGFLGFSVEGLSWLEGYLGRINITLADKTHLGEPFFSPQTLEAVSGAFLGVGITALAYTFFVSRLGKTLPLLKNAFYIDAIYALLIVTPLKLLSRLITSFFEPTLFDGSITWISGVTYQVATGLQKCQSGQIRSYSALMVIGTVAVIAYLIF